MWRPSAVMTVLSGKPARSLISRIKDVVEKTCVPMKPFPGVACTRACSVVRVKLSGTRISGFFAFFIASTMPGIKAGARETLILIGPFI